jgi:hypothetical protein
MPPNQGQRAHLNSYRNLSIIVPLLLTGRPLHLSLEDG